MLVGKAKLDTIEFLLSKFLIDVHISHDDLIVIDFSK